MNRCAPASFVYLLAADQGELRTIASDREGAPGNTALGEISR